MRKRKAIVICLTFSGRVKEIWTVGSYEKMRKKVKEYLPDRIEWHFRLDVRQLEKDEIVRLELPSDQGLIMKRTFL